MHAWRAFFRSMKHGMLRRIKEDLDIETTDMPLLQALFEGCVYPSEVSQNFGMPAPVVSQMIVRSVKGGLVERQLDPEDSRRIRLNLTEEGRRVLESAHRYLQDGIKRSGLSQEELQQTARNLFLLSNALQEEA